MINVLALSALVLAALFGVWVLTRPQQEWQDVPLDDLLTDPIAAAVERHPAGRKH